MGFPRYAWCTPSGSADGVDPLPLPPEIARLPDGVRRVLAARGIADAASLRSFLAPKLADLSDPLTMPSMPAAVARVRQALSREEDILVFADFDADGITAAALLFIVLTALGARVHVFHPHRLREGYGLSSSALARAVAMHPAVRLLITVDCGIRSILEVEEARARGIDTIITDHHAPSEKLPEALAVIHPRRCPPDSPVHALAGVGVAFKLCHALVKNGRASGCPRSRDLDLREWLDLVALGTVADVAPLTGENRALVRHGLERLSRGGSIGFAALMRRSGVAAPVRSHDLAFVLGPRINAAGRMDTADIATSLLTCRDPDTAASLACRLEHLNGLRRLEEKRILNDAEEQVSVRDPRADGGIVVGGDGWHPGAIGIVASRLAERYACPCAVISLLPDGCGRGSVRSYADINLLEVLSGCTCHLEQFGGHAAAAGLRLLPQAMDPFRKAFLSACRTQGGDRLGRPPSLTIDAWLTPSDLSFPFVDAVQRLEPFGEGNPSPCWGLAGVTLRSPPRTLGSRGDHVRLRIALPDGTAVEAVGFNMAADDIPDGRLDLAFRLERNRWNGEDRLQLHLCDLRAAG